MTSREQALVVEDDENVNAIKDEDGMAKERKDGEGMSALAMQNSRELREKTFFSVA